MILDGEESVTITLTNNSDSLALFNRVEILSSPNGEEVKPIIYIDNYVSLFSSKSIDTMAKYKTSDLHGNMSSFMLRGIMITNLRLILIWRELKSEIYYSNHLDNNVSGGDLM
jgi:hypothetical protein